MHALITHRVVVAEHLEGVIQLGVGLGGVLHVRLRIGAGRSSGFMVCGILLCACVGDLILCQAGVTACALVADARVSSWVVVGMSWQASRDMRLAMALSFVNARYVSRRRSEYIFTLAAASSSTSSHAVAQLAEPSYKARDSRRR